MTIDVYLKDPSDVLPFGFDWDEWIGNDTIIASAWTVPTGITNQSNSFNDTTSTIWLTGGTHGQDYLCTNQITTAGGSVKQRTLKIMVRDQ